MTSILYIIFLYILYYHAGIPTAPINLQSIVDVYRAHSSTVLFTWDAPNDNSRVDYYQYEVENGTNSLTYNTSNTTTAILTEIDYNKNVTFSVFSLNCIGKSSPLIQVIHVGKQGRDENLIIKSVSYQYTCICTVCKYIYIIIMQCHAYIKSFEKFINLALLL